MYQPCKTLVACCHLLSSPYKGRLQRQADVILVMQLCALAPCSPHPMDILVWLTTTIDVSACCLSGTLWREREPCVSPEAGCLTFREVRAVQSLSKNGAASALCL